MMHTWAGVVRVNMCVGGNPPVGFKPMGNDCFYGGMVCSDERGVKSAIQYSKCSLRNFTVFRSM